MKYFRDEKGDVHGFDETDPAQEALMETLAADWDDITGSWPVENVPSDDELKAQCKAEAKSRLAETDFSELPSVRAAITNGAEFDAYRAAVRALAINPVTNPTFPERVSAVWA